MEKILLAGATGYLGGYLLEELLHRGYPVKAIVRDSSRLAGNVSSRCAVMEARITEPEEIKGACQGIDTVISCVGITRQKDGLTYEDVDYQANKNLLDEAIKSGVKKFLYVSVLNGPDMTHLKICQAKEHFVSELKRSPLDYRIIRPNGFFSDMKDFLTMAENGRILLFGSGLYKANPIDGSDLAGICIDSLDNPEREVPVGGPETLTQREIAQIAFTAAGKKPRITCLPEWLGKGIIHLMRLLTSEKVYGPVEFFLTVLTRDMIAPEYGSMTLLEYYQKQWEDLKSTKKG